MPFSAVGIGCGRVGSLGNPVAPRIIEKVLAEAARRGITTFDTANIYGQGDSERILGRLFGDRPEIAIVTKAGRLFSGKAQLIGRMKWALRPIMKLRRSVRPAGAAETAPPSLGAMRDANLWQDFSAGALAASFEGSLRRLRRARVEGFLLHDPPTDVIRDTSVAALLSEIKSAGRALHVGASVNTTEDIEAVAERPEYNLVQLPLSLLEGVADTAAYRQLVSRGALVHVRQVLRPGDGSMTPDVGAAIKRARRFLGVTTVLVGVSRPGHLDELAACAD